MTARDIRGERARIAPWVAACVGVCVLCVGAYAYGSAARERAERAEAVAVADESRAFCAAMGLTPQMETFARCVEGLAAIRRRLEDRLNREAIGIL